jgi:xanthine dehydrogenase YagT iron-sulfur-binding subunit
MGSNDDRFDRGPSPSGNEAFEQIGRHMQDLGFDSGITRRVFLTTISLLTAGAAVGIPAQAAQPAASDAQEGAAGHMCDVELTINGQPYKFSLDPRVTLLDLLREQIGLTGTKKGCDHGQCGACTVLANGRHINSCLSLAVAHQGDSIVTVEGLASGGKLHPLQAAFLQHDGFQCGYCTPGQICSAVALLNEAGKGDASIVTPDLTKSGTIELTAQEIRERMSGNICRCGAYTGIIEAIQTCATKQEA